MKRGRSQSLSRASSPSLSSGDVLLSVFDLLTRDALSLVLLHLPPRALVQFVLAIPLSHNRRHILNNLVNGDAFRILYMRAWAKEMYDIFTWLAKGPGIMTTWFKTALSTGCLSEDWFNLTNWKTLLRSACKYGRDNIVRYLIQHVPECEDGIFFPDGDYFAYPLCDATIDGHLNTVKTLLDCAPSNIRGPVNRALEAASYESQSAIFDLLFPLFEDIVDDKDEHDGDAWFNLFAEDGDINNCRAYIIRKVIEYGLKRVPVTRVDVMLEYAVLYRFTDLVARIIEHHNDILAVIPENDLDDLIRYAAEDDSITIFNILTDHPAVQDMIRTRGFLLDACSSGSVCVATKILEDERFFIDGDEILERNGDTNMTRLEEEIFAISKPDLRDTIICLLLRHIQRVSLPLEFLDRILTDAHACTVSVLTCGHPYIDQSFVERHCQFALHNHRTVVIDSIFECKSEWVPHSLKKMLLERACANGWPQTIDNCLRFGESCTREVYTHALVTACNAFQFVAIMRLLSDGRADPCDPRCTEWLKLHRSERDISSPRVRIRLVLKRARREIKGKP